jgi:cellulose biosynthesis protein BcsQ
MATVNVATELARSGARVLLVDFDLEAPSLMTFNLAGTGQPHKGLVDYVLEYLETGVSPDVANFVCESESFPKTGGQLWIMPAGESGPDYPQRNFSVRWKELYEDNDGYLFIENLKAQWQEVFQPDYVLIDSRTGHNEVMGICTRQLPHAVCAVFVPNPQNLEGLQEVVNSIRTQERNSEGAPIQLHFVASNIPYEDDERGTLATALARYKEALEASSIVSIHHYRVLALLGQAIFVLTSPNVALSQEYRALTDRLRTDNLEDRTSALRYLRDALKRSSDPLESPPVEPRLKLIAERHKDDPEVLFWLARVRQQLGASTEAAVLLDQSIATGKATGRAYIERAGLHLQQEDSQRLASARADFIEAIKRLKGPADYRETLVAVRSLAALGDVDWEHIVKYSAINSLPASVQLTLTEGLDTSDEEMQATRCILRQVGKDNAFSDEENQTWHTQLALALVRLREFSEVISLLAPGDLKKTTLSQRDAFNLAVAMWGRDGIPSADLFQHVLDLHSEEAMQQSANYYQCLAISALVCGRKELAQRFRDTSFEIVRNMAGMEFSAWRYLRISPVNFVHDLAALRTMIDSGEVFVPPVVSRSP